MLKRNDHYTPLSNSENTRSRIEVNSKRFTNGKCDRRTIVPPTNQSVSEAGVIIEYSITEGTNGAT